MAIDYEHFYAYAQLPATPDVFIIPSELRYFVKVGFSSAFFQTHQNQPLTCPSRPPAPALPGSADVGMVASFLEAGSRTRKQICQ